MTAVPPVRREIVVAATPDIAFRVFTERIGRWWPLADHSVYGADATVGFDAGDIVEVAADGRRAVWGSVTDWQPGRMLAFTWHPGKDASSSSRVTVAFAPSGDGTLVTLVHDGWEVFADPTAAQEEYGHGWPNVLARYCDDVPQAAWA